ncbi:MAG TPA: hypothetical protein VMP01_19550 [Pirellulaceae bacterium]|nr:hypothetical protein [Pirellulaceae bacterium]
MPNGKPGDHPLTDMLVQGKHPFPADIEQMLRDVLSLDPMFPDGKRRYVDQVAWDRRFVDWERGENLDEGRSALRSVLAELRGERSAGA